MSQSAPSHAKVYKDGTQDPPNTEPPGRGCALTSLDPWGSAQEKGAVQENPGRWSSSARPDVEASVWLE